MIEKVISGGQSGADIAGLLAAAAYNIPTGGYMPKGYRTLDGPRPEYAIMFNLVELDSANYPPRTERNVVMSDVTIRFASNWQSPGERCTLRYIEQYSKPYVDIDIRGLESYNHLDVAEWLQDNKYKIINIAGNSEKTSPGIEEWVYEFLFRVFKYMTEFDAALKAVGGNREHS